VRRVRKVKGEGEGREGKRGRAPAEESGGRERKT
jgi:hypothetical protein